MSEPVVPAFREQAQFFSLSLFNVRLNGYEFPTQGYVYMISGAAIREEPDYSLPGIGNHHADPYKENPVHYVGKTDGSNRMWVKFSDGTYMTIGQFKLGLPNLVKTTDRHDKTGKPISVDYKDWEENFSMDNLTPSDNFEPTAEEKTRLQELHNQVIDGGHADDVLISYVADTHFDSYKTPSTVNVLRSMMLMSWYVKTYGVDLVIHGGDLNDGVKPKMLSEIDVKLGTDAIKTSHRPYIILQGNHDDNSGYVRDEAALKTDQLLLNTNMWKIRGSKWLKRPTGTQNPNDAVFGTYEIPNSNITVVVLDGFDQPDIRKYGDGNGTHWRSFRHGATFHSAEQRTWLKNTLNSMASNIRVLFFNHIALNGGTGMSWTNDASQSSKFEYSGTNADGVAESKDVFSIIKNYQSRTNNVIGYISGHTHRDAYSNPTTSGNIQFVTQTAGLADRGDGADLRSTDDLNSAWSIYRISAVNGSIDQFRYGYKHSTGFKSGWKFNSLS